VPLQTILGEVKSLLAPLIAAALLSASTPALAVPPLAGPVADPAADPDPWLGRDKAYHFLACAGISALTYGVAALGTPDIRLRVVFGAGAGIGAGAAKELLDLAGFGDPSWKDFAWDVIGTVIGMGIAVSVDFAARGIQPIQATAR
jgi:putative lipoprotein